MILRLSDYFQINLAAEPYATDGLSLIFFGNKGSGKSYGLAVLAEEAHRNGLPFLFFDINGDADSLRELGEDVMVVGRTKASAPLRRAHFDLLAAFDDPARFIYYALEQKYKIVFDLSGRVRDERVSVFAHLASTLYQVSEDLRQPCLVLVDEAHNFAPQQRPTRAQREAMDAFDLIMSDGRKRGLLLAVATQRAQKLNKDIVSGMTVRLFGKVHHEPDYDSIRGYIPPGYSFNKLRRFGSGQFVVWSAGQWSEIVVRGRQTADLGKTPIPTPANGSRPSVAELKQMPLWVHYGAGE